MFISAILQGSARESSGSPVLEVVVAALTLTVLLSISREEPQAGCMLLRLADHVEGTFLLVGSGALIVVGSSSLMHSLRLSTGHWEETTSSDLTSWPKEITIRGLQIAVLAIGGGLVAGGYFAWRTYGQLAAHGPNRLWMATTWLLALMSILSWQPGHRRQLLGTGLTILATISAILGLLVLGTIRHLVGVP
jgi:hypothetical protein